jgi:hypothetical protein
LKVFPLSLAPASKILHLEPNFGLLPGRFELSLDKSGGIAFALRLQALHQAEELVGVARVLLEVFAEDLLGPGSVAA